MGGPNRPKICSWRTKTDFKDWEGQHRLCLGIQCSVYAKQQNIHCKEETLRMDGVKKSFCEHDRASVRCNKALDYKTFGSSLNCNAYTPHSWRIHERKKIPSIFVRFWVYETGYLSRVSNHHLHHYNHTIQGGRS